MLDPSLLEDSYLAHWMSMYYHTQVNAELQSSLLMVYDETNTYYGLFDDYDGD